MSQTSDSDALLNRYWSKVSVWVCSCQPPLFSLRQQKARDNRAAQRINKVQLSNDPLKRHQPTQPPPPPLGPYDPVAMEMEGAFKDPLRPKETEQEQEWKLRQVSRVSVCLSLTHHPPWSRTRERNQHQTLVPYIHLKWSGLDSEPSQMQQQVLMSEHVTWRSCTLGSGGNTETHFINTASLQEKVLKEQFTQTVKPSPLLLLLMI